MLYGYLVTVTQVFTKGYDKGYSILFQGQSFIDARLPPGLVVLPTTKVKKKRS